MRNASVTLLLLAAPALAADINALIRAGGTAVSIGAARLLRAG